MRLGIIGKPQSGKTTIFNLLTGLDAVTADFSGKIEPNLGNIKVPDDRLDYLTSIYEPKKTVPAEINFVDIPAPPNPDRNTQTAIYQHIRNCQALVLVIRGFNSNLGGAAKPLDEYNEVSAELIISDQIILENRVSRIRKEKGKTTNPLELAVLEKCLAWIEKENSLRTLELSDAELKLISGYQFLSLKPLLSLINVDDSQPDYQDLTAVLSEDSVPQIVINGQMELEISRLDEDDRPMFMEEMGITEVARDRFIQTAYRLLNQVSFLTVGKDEVRAWTVKSGSKAPLAGGVIHSDIQRGFIRAEVIAYRDFVEYGGEAGAKKAGKARSEGKEYEVQDGDIINFRFNV